MSQIRATCGAAVVRRRTSSSRGIRRPRHLEETALPQVSAEIQHLSHPLTADRAIPCRIRFVRPTRSTTPLDAPHHRTPHPRTPRPKTPTTPPDRCRVQAETIEVVVSRSTNLRWHGRQHPTMPNPRSRVFDAPRLPDPHDSPLHAALTTPNPPTQHPRQRVRPRVPGPLARTRRRRSPSRCLPTTAGRAAGRLLPLDARIGVRPRPLRRHLDVESHAFVDHSSADPDASAGSS